MSTIVAVNWRNFWNLRTMLVFFFVPSFRSMYVHVLSRFQIYRGRSKRQQQGITWCMVRVDITVSTQWKRDSLWPITPAGNISSLSRECVDWSRHLHVRFAHDGKSYSGMMYHIVYVKCRAQHVHNQDTCDFRGTIECDSRSDSVQVMGHDNSDVTQLNKHNKCN